MYTLRNEIHLMYILFYDHFKIIKLFAIRKYIRIFIFHIIYILLISSNCHKMMVYLINFFNFSEYSRIFIYSINSISICKILLFKLIKGKTTKKANTKQKINGIILISCFYNLMRYSVVMLTGGNFTY